MDPLPFPRGHSPGDAATRVPRPRPPLRDDQVLVTGDISHDWVITTADLHAHAREPVDVYYVTTRFREVHHVQGVPLHDLLARSIYAWTNGTPCAGQLTPRRA